MSMDKRDLDHHITGDWGERSVGDDAPQPMGAAEVQVIREAHSFYRHYDATEYCARCRLLWPCDVQRLLATIDALEAERTQLRDRVQDEAPTVALMQQTGWLERLIDGTMKSTAWGLRLELTPEQRQVLTRQLCHALRAQITNGDVAAHMARRLRGAEAAELEAAGLREALRNCVTEIKEMLRGTTILSWSVPMARRVLGELRDGGPTSLEEVR